MNAPYEDKGDGGKDNFYMELQHVFGQFPKYHMTIWFGDFSANVGVMIFWIGIESLHEISNDDDNGVKTLTHKIILFSRV